MITLITGGSGCGKSTYAESRMLSYSLPRVYVATMIPCGEDAARRIARHRQLRAGKGFETLEKGVDVGGLPLPEGAGEVTSLAYSEFFRLSEDFDYIYIFRDKFGGYMIPKESLKEEEGQFRRFLQEKTGQTIYRKTTPAMRVFKEFKLFASRKNEPPHL